MAGEPGDDRDRRPVLTVDPEHRDTVVDRPLAPHAVDGDARRATGPRPDARRTAMPPGGVDGTGELVGEAVGVAVEGRYVGETSDGRSARDARRAVIVRRVDQHGLRRDPRQLLHELARPRRELGAGEDEVERDDRDGGAAVIEDERLRDHRVVDAVGQARAERPAAGRQPGRRGDVDACGACGERGHRSAPFLVRSLTAGPSARRRPRAAAS